MKNPCYDNLRCGATKCTAAKMSGFFGLMDSDFDAWLSLVERCVRDAEVAGSNPVASTFHIFVCLSTMRGSAW